MTLPENQKFLWAVKSSASGTYKEMPTPSNYKIDWEDLDADSYRSTNTGNLKRTLVSAKWFKGEFSYNALAENVVEEIMSDINHYPLYVKIKSPLFGSNGIIEIQAYVSRASVEMVQNKNNNGQIWNSLSFNIIQSRKISGQ